MQNLYKNITVYSKYAMQVSGALLHFAAMQKVDNLIGKDGSSQ